MMRIIDGTIRRTKALGKRRDLSREGKKRFAWFDFYEGHERNAALTCRHFAISRQTFYKWKRRYDLGRLDSLEDRCHRPRRVRRPTWGKELARAVLEIREERPRWGKDNLAVLLRDRGWEVSTSMVGRDSEGAEGQGSPQRAVGQRDISPQEDAQTPLRPSVSLKGTRWSSRGTWSKWTPWT